MHAYAYSYNCSKYFSLFKLTKAEDSQIMVSNMKTEQFN